MSCGALTRGLFRDLDLGTPQIARAVVNGLDFYLLLGVAQTDDIHTIARRYRQLRVLFPDDPRGLAPEPARRLALLDLAGRTLTDPRLRQTYDDLRAGGATLTNTVVRCAGCAAPLPAEAHRCAFCGTPRGHTPQAPGAPPDTPCDSAPAAEPVDYYALIGLNAEHLLPPAQAAAQPVRATLRYALSGSSPDLAGAGPIVPAGPPSPAAIDAACLARQQSLLLAPGYSPEERDARVDEIEIARRILRDDQRRARYDALLLSFRQGLYGGGRLDSLRQLQDLVRADLADERGEAVSAEQGAALLKQGQGYLDARLPRQALEPLRRAVAALPQSAAAHQAYVRALLGADDPLGLGGHALRMALRSLEALAKLGAADTHHAALAALCRGLLARDEGDAGVATAELRRATTLDPALAPGWRGLAALALGVGDVGAAIESCRQALALDPRDERALLMLCAAYLHAHQRDQAREVARQVVALRGDGSTAESVLHELAR